MDWLEKQWTRYQEVITYIFFGGLTTTVNFTVFYLLNNIVGIPYLGANALAIVIAILFAYYTNSTFVFDSKAGNKKEKMKEFILFVTMRAGTGVFDMVSMFILISLFSLDSTLSKILTQGLVVILNYIFNKLVVFK